MSEVDDNIRTAACSVCAADIGWDDDPRPPICHTCEIARLTAEVTRLKEELGLVSEELDLVSEQRDMLVDDLERARGVLWELRALAYALQRARGAQG